MKAAGWIRLVPVLGDRFSGYVAGAMRHVATLFGWMVPGTFRHFRLAERDAAITWVAEAR
jgi:hypothetical protein